MSAELFHVFPSRDLLVENVSLNLIDRRNYLHITCEVDEMVRVEIAHADSTEFTFLICSFKSKICPVTIAERLMEKHQIDVISAEFAQALVNRCKRFVKPVV